MAIGDQIKKLRKAQGLTQAQFGERIGIKQNTIAQMETQARNTSAQTIRAICREFNVNELWLTQGLGPMFQPATSYNEVRDFVFRVCAEEPDDFKVKLIKALAKLGPKEWAALERFALELEKEMNSKTKECKATQEQGGPLGVSRMGADLSDMGKYWDALNDSPPPSQFDNADNPPADGED